LISWKERKGALKVEMRFSVCDLVVFGHYLSRTLHPVEDKLAPIRNIVYGVGSKFYVKSANDVCAVLLDDKNNSFTISLEKLDTLFEVI
jgi:hypothetical protein